MEVASRNPSWDVIIQELEDKPLAPLEDARKKTLEALLAYIKSLGISFSKEGKDVDEKVLEKILAYCLPRLSSVSDGYVEKQLDAGIKAFKELLRSYQGQHPNVPLELTEFVALAHVSLSSDRLDGYVLDAYLGVMSKEFATREKHAAELKTLTAELKIYSLIQSRINARMAKEGGININNDLDLLDRTLYGYAATDDKWLESAEYKFIKTLDTGQNNKLSVKEFLVGGPKESGAIAIWQLNDHYEFKKENNPIASFATMVGDRSRPINDKVSEKTTLLNDVSSRYNSAIEAIKRFIDKYASVMSDILRAI